MAKMEIVSFGYDESDSGGIVTFAVKATDVKTALFLLAQLSGTSGAAEQSPAPSKPAAAKAATTTTAPRQATVTAPTKPTVASIQIETEKGPATLTPQPDGSFKATMGGVTVDGPTEDEAIGALLEAVTKVSPRITGTPANGKPAVERTTTPARARTATPKATAANADDDFGAPEGEAAPDGLVNATSFRMVVQWMIDNGITDQDSIVATCEKFRPQVPAISRLAGDLNDRIKRALEVMLPDAAAAN